MSIQLRKAWQFVLFAFLVLCLTPSSGYSAENINPKQASMDFTSVAKKAIPAVVSIKVKSLTKQKLNFYNPWGTDEDSDSNDLFNNDLFQRFFGIPKRNQQEEQEHALSQASGFIISEDGYILTNNHVVKDNTEILVTLNNGDEYKAKVIGSDDNTDVALIKIDAKNLPFLKLGNSDDLEVGQWVVAIGNPMGLQASLTVGVVSATGRNNLDLTRIEDFIQTDAAINRGNSGGPLLNLDSEVVGMNTAIVTNMATGGYMGIGFAIPSNILKVVKGELLSNGSLTRGFLGVTLQTVDKGLAEAFGLKKAEGALVAEVAKGSPAEKAGLKQGDIILKYNKLNVNSIAGLRNAISLMKPGTKILLSVLRNGKIEDINVDVGTYPKETAAAESKHNKYGFEVQNLTPELAQSYGYTEDKGIVISKVNPGSPAAWAGLKKGILILAVNQQKVSTVDEFQKTLEDTEKGKPLLLLVKQGNVVRYISLQVD